MSNTALAEETSQDEIEYSPIGDSWEDVRDTLLTPEERAECELSVAVMCAFIDARNKKGYSQRKLAEMSGVKQSVIARMETGSTSPQLGTVLKVLFAMGKTLCIKNLPKSKSTALKEPLIK
ncbi:MAG: helix-turn-helix domain-containing protein [Synergistaceae bacterium]|jgi:ribosome-binding protein aMBF1 (putative translation factor)|nr:helix-turn-helix domain-containing protein [Synergistaceae bacterium]